MSLASLGILEEAELLQDAFHVIIPMLDGHAGSDRPFTSIGDCASELIRFIDSDLGGSAALIGGLSLGGQVLLEMLSRRSGLCRCAFVESAMAIPAGLTHALIGPSVRSSAALVRNRRFAGLQFRSLHIRPDLFEDYYRDTCRIRTPDMVAFLKASTGYALKDSIRSCGARVHLFIGGKENRGIRRSAELVRSVLPDCALTVLPGYVHGDFSINHPEDYARAVRDALGQPG